jgi:hypothetical protein
MALGVVDKFQPVHIADDDSEWLLFLRGDPAVDLLFRF